MFSLLFGKKRNDTGTGYGGSIVNDLRELKRGREAAAKEQSTRDAETLAFLILCGKSLRNKTLDDTDKLVSILKGVFRNQVPTEWIKQKKILLLSLTCLGLMMRNYNDILGNVTDTESLAAAFDEFAQHAQFLKTHQHGRDHARMVTKILELYSRMNVSASGEKTNGVVVESDDPPTVYRKTLTPLRFDFCESLQNYSFSSKPQSTKLNMRTLFQELSTFKSALPVEYGSSIFVRTVEGRLDLLRALIIGPEDTPYANGCFLFDIWLQDYPNKPPKVQFITTAGGRINFNPNLYKNGKVCLSLLGTWDGPGWVKGESTLLQVLVSIQSLIFCHEPFYNEPLFAAIRGLGMLHTKSVAYNGNIRRHALQHAILPFIHGSHLFPEFRNVMQLHFSLKKEQIQQQMQQWMADDPTLSSIVELVSSKLSRRFKTDKVRKVNDDGEGEPPRKKQKTKRAARGQQR